MPADDSSQYEDSGEVSPGSREFDYDGDTREVTALAHAGRTKSKRELTFLDFSGPGAARELNNSPLSATSLAQGFP